jgi:hypothetical protein
MLNVGHLFYWSTTIFQDITHAHWQTCPILAWVKKFHHDRHRDIAFTSIHEQPLPLPHYYIPGWDKYMNLVWDYVQNTDTWMDYMDYI